MLRPTRHAPPTRQVRARAPCAPSASLRRACTPCHYCVCLRCARLRTAGHVARPRGRTARTLLRGRSSPAGAARRLPCPALPVATRPRAGHPHPHPVWSAVVRLLRGRVAPRGFVSRVYDGFYAPPPPLPEPRPSSASLGLACASARGPASAWRGHRASARSGAPRPAHLGAPHSIALAHALRSDHCYPSPLSVSSLWPGCPSAAPPWPISSLVGGRPLCLPSAAQAPLPL